MVSATTTNTPMKSTQLSNIVPMIRERVGLTVVGQEEMVERTLVALFTGGHLLLQGMPGLAKTLLVNTMASAIDLGFSRIQFTVDMLPSDIIGSEILDQRTNDFRTVKGPVFTNLLLADEINRAAPKVQGALLEAMQERKVTIGGETHLLPAPFLVIATQNPVEQSGTFELPEAQLDRFMMCHRLDYPKADEEEEIVHRQLGMKLKRQGDGAIPESAFDQLDGQQPVASLPDLVKVMEIVQSVHVSDVVTKHVVELARRTRSNELIELGCSPRAGLAMVMAARARAFIHDRDYVVPDDIFALAEDVILHRIRLSYEALAEGYEARQLLEDILVELG